MFNTWQWFALLSAFFAGLVAIFAKLGVNSIPSNVATFLRTVVIAFFLIGLISVRKEWMDLRVLDTKSIVFLVLSALATGLSWICYFKALQVGPASGVVALDKLSLIFAILLSVVFLGEHLQWVQWVGVALMFGGAFLVVYKG